jgi:drug/metabolite transporter (DMT)-like permease
MVIAAALGAIGQLFLRAASPSFAATVNGTVLNWPLYGFAVTYGIAVLLNILAYRMGGSTNSIYPIIATSYLFAAVLAAWWFLEPMGWKQWVGGMIIIAGVWLMRSA